MADLRASGLGGVPKGATADRPSSPSIGDVFYNGTLGCLEIYTSQGWVANSAPPAIPTIAPSAKKVCRDGLELLDGSVVFGAAARDCICATYSSKRIARFPSCTLTLLCISNTQ